MYEQVMASTKNPEEALKIMISGAPASGKGTQCELITQKVSSSFLHNWDCSVKAVFLKVDYLSFNAIENNFIKL